jgi:hypothetical protein
MTEIERIRYFLAGVLSLSANQALSMSTMDMVTMLAHQRDEARGVSECSPAVRQQHPNQLALFDRPEQ